MCQGAYMVQPRADRYAGGDMDLCLLQETLYI